MIFTCNQHYGISSVKRPSSCPTEENFFLAHKFICARIAQLCGSSRTRRRDKWFEQCLPQAERDVPAIFQRPNSFASVPGC